MMCVVCVMFVRSLGYSYYVGVEHLKSCCNLGSNGSPIRNGIMSNPCNTNAAWSVKYVTHKLEYSVFLAHPVYRRRWLRSAGKRPCFRSKTTVSSIRFNIIMM